MNRHKLNIIYEGVMICIIIISLIALMSDSESRFKYIHTIIWGIFMVDVSIRFIRATIKWKYVKNNTFDIISIIPLEDIFLLARFSRFLKLFRYKNIVKRYMDRVSEQIEKFGFVRISIYIVAGNTLLAVILYLVTNFKIVESNLWVWSNFLKFNYKTKEDGLIILSIIVKIIGVMYMGILLSEGVSYLRGKYERYKERKEDK